MLKITYNVIFSLTGWVCSIPKVNRDPPHEDWDFTCSFVQTSLRVKQLFLVFKRSFLYFTVPIAPCAFPGWHWKDPYFVFFSLPVRYLSTKLYSCSYAMSRSLHCSFKNRIFAFSVRGPFSISPLGTGTRRNMAFGLEMSSSPVLSPAGCCLPLSSAWR